MLVFVFVRCMVYLSPAVLYYQMSAYLYCLPWLNALPRKELPANYPQRPCGGEVGEAALQPRSDVAEWAERLTAASPPG